MVRGGERSEPIVCGQAADYLLLISYLFPEVAVDMLELVCLRILERETVLLKLGLLLHS